jgi:hypothetical protein
MRQRSFAGTYFSALVTGGIFLCCGFAMGQDNSAPSLQDQLKAQYTLVKLGIGPAGFKVVKPGTVLDVQKAGLLGVPPQSMMACPAKVQDGEVKSPTGMCAAMVKQVSRFMQVGDKVYVTKIDVSLDKDRVSIQLMECDSCNGVQQPSFYKSEVFFQFPKGSLQNPDVSKIEDTIGQVLAIDNGDSQGDQGAQDQGGQQGGNNQQGNNQGGGGQAQQGQQQQQAAPAEPQQIAKGQTPEQVKAALGNPDKIVNLGAKLIYVYKDLKVTFLDGKVSDVQ